MGRSLAGVMTLDQCWQISEAWYAGRLDLEFRRPPREFFQGALHRAGLSGDAWSLTAPAS